MRAMYEGVSSLTVTKRFSNKNRDVIRVLCYLCLTIISLQNVLCDADFEKCANVTLEKNTDARIWSDFLEDYVTSLGAGRVMRKSKDMVFETSPLSLMSHNFNGPQAPINYHSSAYKRPSYNNNNNIYVTRRIGEAAELEPHLRKPIEPPVTTPIIVNPQFRPMTNQMLQQQQLQQQQQQRQQPGFLQQLFGFGGNVAPPSAPPTQQQPPIRPMGAPLQQPQHHTLSNGQQNFRAVSENDLYLLGAIEKLVYRVDYLESRLRRAEQLIYYLMAGNKEKEAVRDPCPANFTRISDNCYYINSQQQVNWKTANTACKALNAQLTEFERASENEEIMAYLLNQPQYRGRDYWLGGLNPGLLWIWSNSAKPVNPNTNLTSIAMSQKHENATSANLIDSDEEDVDDQANTQEILNNTMEIPGQGRCLRLAYNASKHTYAYYGQECTTRQHYICETEDKTLDNKIKKIARELKLFV